MLCELDQLVVEQEIDDRSRHVISEPNRTVGVITFDPRKLNKIIDEKGNTPTGSKKISWGMPALIFQAKQDKICPKCSRSAKRKQFHDTRLIDGFDLGFDEKGCFGGLCAETTTRTMREASEFSF